MACSRMILRPMKSDTPRNPWLRRMKEIQQSICHLTTQFLVETHRVLEVSSGLPLERCFLVRVNQTSHVEEVVMEGVPSL